MDEAVSRREWEAQLDAIRQEEKRQNRRLEMLEGDMKALTDMTVSMKEMAVNMGHMTRELESQGKRLEQIEQIPASRWNGITSAAITAIGAVLGGALIAALIHFL